MLHTIESLTHNKEKDFLVVVTKVEKTRWQWTVPTGTVLETGSSIHTLTLHELLVSEIFRDRKDNV